jgi:ferredoxin-NADP reductase/MOSC domain-containing protein YiiM/predicted pyridoxine 5'-phosphate oxidase superfamily flavin-nucleotide-binding protein
LSDSESPFHQGEKEIQRRLGVADRIEQLGRRMIQRRMPDRQQVFFSELPLLFVGTADATGRPWASVLYGQPGFLHPIDAGVLRVETRPIYGDPLNRAIIEGARIGTLGMEFETRNRARMNGTITNAGEDGFEIRVMQSFGNCDWYIQTREPALETGPGVIGEKRLVRRDKALNQTEAALVARSDAFFIASQALGSGGWTDGIDVSHRGGRPGFVIVVHESSLLFPDYAGNCMFNTFGNLQLDPRAGLLFIDFETGDALQMTGEAEVLWEPHHTARFPGADRVVAFRVEETLHIEQALPISWSFGEYSPRLDAFEPVVRRTPSADELRPMRLLSVNLSMPKEIAHENKHVMTGIFKIPIDGRVMLRRLNLDGDGQADLWGHGGTFRAVYVYSRENYDYWRRELGRDDVGYGKFGENFTVEGMLEDDICVGDVFRIGGALVEVSQPRIPCYKLAIRMGTDDFQKRFLESGRVGFYLRVLEEGEVGAGDIIELVGRDPNGMTIRVVSDLLFYNTEDLEGTRKALSIPALSHGWKASFEERLAGTGVAIDTGTGFRNFLVRRKEAESETITSFYLVPDDSKPLTPYLPGQFLTFELAMPGNSGSVMRTYSLSDSPDRDYYRVSIKREPPPDDRPDLPPGLSSSYFHERVDVGTTLLIGPPRGKFHLDPDSDRAVVLLSGGVGVTPLLSMMNAIVRSGTGRRVWFIHGARNGREQAFGAHIRRMARENDNVTAHIRYSAPVPDDAENRDFNSKGHVDIELLKQLLPFDDYEFYLCGPVPFMKSLYCGLLSMGVAESRVHYEFFGPASALTEDSEPRGQAPARPPSEELGGECEVAFARSGITAAWDPACETILDLAEHHGLSPPYSCRSGICRTCMCELVEGEVKYLEEPLNAPDPGCVLICVSRPKTKIVVDI